MYPFQELVTHQHQSMIFKIYFGYISIYQSSIYLPSIDFKHMLILKLPISIQVEVSIIEKYICIIQSLIIILAISFSPSEGQMEKESHGRKKM